MNELIAMETPLEGLHASSPATLPFAPSLEIRAFLLARGRGNLLIYDAPSLEGDGAMIEELGGISRHYLNHRHEAMFAAAGIDAPLLVHREEAAAVEESSHVRATFSRRHVLDEDFEVIPTPGHTPGATAYLWTGGGHRFLFTGDSVYLDRGAWVAAVLASSDRDAYLESLELIRGLDFDVLVPWAATAGEPFWSLTTRAETDRRIGAIIERVRAGGDR